MIFHFCQVHYAKWHKIPQTTPQNSYNKKSTSTGVLFDLECVLDKRSLDFLLHP